MEERLLEKGLKAKLKQENMLKQNVPSFKPHLNQLSLKMAAEKRKEDKKLVNNSSLFQSILLPSGSASARMTHHSNDDFERDLIREMDKISHFKEQLGDFHPTDSEEVTPNFQREGSAVEGRKIESILNAFRSTNL